MSGNMAALQQAKSLKEGLMLLQEHANEEREAARKAGAKETEDRIRKHLAMAAEECDPQHMEHVGTNKKGDSRHTEEDDIITLLERHEQIMNARSVASREVELMLVRFQEEKQAILEENEAAVR